MEKSITFLTSNMSMSTGATESDLGKVILSIPFTLPKDYIEFLKCSNGAKGRLGKKFLIIWGTHDIISLNEMYKVSLLAPGLFLFGSDGGDEGYGFDFRGEKTGIVEIPFICMDWDDAKNICNSFMDFLYFMNE